MSLKDIPAHTRGKRHQLALSKADAKLEPLPGSSCTVLAVKHGKEIQGKGLAGNDKATSTIKSPAFLAGHTTATLPAGSLASDKAIGSTVSTDPFKLVTHKAGLPKRVKQSGGTMESVVTSLASVTLGS
ncbi:hypothetical protein IMSHALPRED_007407 [Imshaugia aleurites]|uniref:Uncharacterized protein n=1 Tax=Imshaugia aleurites TaxID=172621 RepID=A0A8H3IP68_9LECA|nr:hypothetical protein IMSHALPRED_007407 [Imshaugia aleurites]